MSTNIIQELEMIITHKGILVRHAELTPPKWAGDPYREEQKRAMSAVPPDTTLCVGRGTRSIRISEYPKTEKTIFLQKIVLSTARGTGTRIL
ncbi:MAG: hypothetical protein QW177_06380 [Candidatus Nitrosotenuis sp.]